MMASVRKLYFSATRLPKRRRSLQFLSAALFSSSSSSSSSSPSSSSAHYFPSSFPSQDYLRVKEKPLIKFCELALTSAGAKGKGENNLEL